MNRLIVIAMFVAVLAASAQAQFCTSGPRGGIDYSAGTPVGITKRSHWGGPLELRVRGCKLSLRREVAQRIQVAAEQRHGH